MHLRCRNLIFRADRLPTLNFLLWRQDSFRNVSRCKGSFQADYKYRKVASDHVYRTLHPWKTREDLARYLSESVVYNKDGLIAINKPSGVAIYQQTMPTTESGRKLVVETLSSCDLNHCSLTVSDTLPFLADTFKVPELRIIKTTEKYTSGIVLLSSNSGTEENVTRAINRAKAQAVPSYTYWAVTSCVPLALQEAKRKIGIKIIDIKEHDQKVAVIDTSPSKRGILVRGNIKSAIVEYNVIKFNPKFDSALIEISTSTRGRHFLRVYLAHKLAPIIGDGLYSTRVKNILGKPTAVSPYNKVCYDPPTLSMDLCNQLRIPLSAVPSLPTHLHLHRINLVGYDQGGGNLLIDCPPSDFFLWTCKQLELLPDKIERKKLIA